MNKALSEQQVAAQGRELATAKWELPEKFRLTTAFLDLSPEEQKKQNPELHALWEKTKDEQARLAALNASPHGRPSSQEIFRARSVQRAEEVRVTIERLSKQISDILVGNGEGDLVELQAAKLALRHRRAEQLALHGRFDLAATEEPDPQYRDHYLAILDAVWRDDSEVCDCSDVRGSGEHADITVPRHFVKEEVFSVKHGEVRPVIKCSRCGEMNVTELPGHLREQRSHRAQAMKLVGKLSIEDAARVLTEKGHTAANLLRKK